MRNDQMLILGICFLTIAGYEPVKNYDLKCWKHLRCPTQEVWLQNFVEKFETGMEIMGYTN